MTLRILVVIGTRPEAIKLAPVVRALAATPGVVCRVCVTGQHRDLVAPALALFGIVPDIDLGVASAGQSLAALTADLLAALDALLATERPDRVVVQGDTASALAGAMAAHFRRIPVAHVEAGLRTGDRNAPFPEETSRRLIADLADVHFAPTDAARAALLAEGIAAEDVVVSGNTVVDALQYARTLPFDPVAAGLDRVVVPDRPLVLVTAHRRENRGQPIAELCAAVRALAMTHPALQFAWPVHPHPDVDGPVRAALADTPGVHLLPPLDYRAFLWLFEQARVVVTDSGGVQEEAVAFGRPVVVMRARTERGELVAAGLATLVAPDATELRAAVAAALERPTRIAAANPFGDGHAAERVRDRLLRDARQDADPATLFAPFPSPQPDPIFVPDRRRVLVVGGDRPGDPGRFVTSAEFAPVVMLRPGAPAPGRGGPERAEFDDAGVTYVARPDVAAVGPGFRGRLVPYADAVLREIVRQRARAVVAIGRADLAIATVVAARWAGIPAIVLDAPGWQVEVAHDDFDLATAALQVARERADLVVAVGPGAEVALADLVPRAEAAFAATQTTLPPARPLAAHTIALISDPFTARMFEQEAQVVSISSRDWQTPFAAHRFDALVIESTWYGVDRSWQGLTHRNKGVRSVLDEVVGHCRAAGIPVLFWNKEDPPHRSGFLGTAVEADIVFTSDANSIPAYLRDPDLRAAIAVSLPFAAQPALHNPLPPARPWDPTIAFGGTWWQGIFHNRTRFQGALLGLVAPLGLSIYDRHYRNGKSSQPFPERLASHVRGGLDYDEMVQAYRSHPVHLNVNSVDDSPTMFARRVFEVAACGTAGLSGPGRGVTEVLGDVVPVVSRADHAVPILAGWLADPSARLEDARRAMLTVYRAHLASHRLAFMLRVAGLRVSAPALPAYALRCDQVDAAVAAAILAQTVLPALVVSADPGAVAALPGVRVAPPAAIPGGVQEIGLVGWVDRFVAADIAPEHYEDLLTTRWYDTSEAVGMVDVGTADPPRLVIPGAAIDPFGGLVRGNLATLLGDAPLVSVQGLGVRRPAGAR
jgi:UDP-N-acetylglucosamine 2-epimerase (non-hydrolysing)